MSKALTTAVGVFGSVERLEVSNQSLITTLSADLTRSLRRPSRRTLTLIDKALAWLRPFESPKAMTASSYEKRELLELLTTHRTVLLPYIDTDRVESHLRQSSW